MRLLLDTHIWIWSLTEPEKLIPPAAGALADPDSELWLSPVSVWELLLLVDKRRIGVEGDDVNRWIDSAFQKVVVNEAPLTHEIVRATRRLSFPHRDPADRFIAATAHVLGLTLVTADERLLGVKHLRTLSAR